VVSFVGIAVSADAAARTETAETGQIQANMGKKGTKSQETCGNQGFSVDFAQPEVAL
jgi:hypothetical protein